MNDIWWIHPDQLDGEQRAIVSLPADGSFLVTGPPGSGKTNLLLLRARYLDGAGKPNFIILVFTRTLEEFIAHCPLGYRVSREKLKTSQRWHMELINELGGVPNVTGTFEQQRRENCEILLQLAEEQGIGVMYDALLLDEAQDYSDAELKLFLRLSRNIFAVADPRQQIYKTGSALRVLESFCTQRHLQFHYRNGRKICALADHIGQNWRHYVPMLPKSQYDESSMPSRVEHNNLATIQDQAERIIEAVRIQLRAYPDQLIGVLCPRHLELSLVRDMFARTDLEPLVIYQSADNGYIPFESDKRICLCTLHSAKGLEFRSLHIAGAEWSKNFRNVQRRLVYTGITRAKTRLSFYYSSPLPPYLQSALAAVGPPPVPPSVEDLFEDTDHVDL